MKEMIILADDLRVQARGNLVELTIYNPDFNIEDVMTMKEIVNNVDDLYGLIDEIMKRDDGVLHDYLESAGYIFNKG